jgi:beta-ribofuranosylaminobenzene 5'-phosphate synthase
MIKIVTPSRLHITLIDLNASLGRVDGGVGVTLDEPSVILTAEEDDEIDVSGPDEFANRARRSTEKIAKPYGVGARIKIERIFPAHVGLGLGTQLSLAAGMAVNMLYDIGLSVRDLAKLVGRGGTSGIGVASFERGGFIVDGGHRSDKGFLPSSASPANPPPVLFREEFPDWDIVLAIPELKGAHDGEEVEIFRKECPIPLGEVQAISHLILMKMLPSLLEEDIFSFGASINEIQEVGFKRREIAIQHPIVKAIMEKMIDSGAYGAGMSSVGPTVYCIAEDPNEIKNAVEDSLMGKGAIMTAKARNEGARFTY